MAIIKPSAGRSSAAMMHYLLGGKSKRSPEVDTEKRYLAYDSEGFDNHWDIEKNWKAVRDSEGIRYRDPERQAKLRAYAHFSISAKEQLSDKQWIEIGKEFAERYAPGHQFSLYIHRDTDHNHAHILINSVNMETGRRFHINNAEQSQLKEEFSQYLFDKYGIFHEELKHSKDRTPDQVIHQEKREPNYYSWQKDLKDRIARAKTSAISKDDFLKKLEQAGVRQETAVITNGKGRSYRGRGYRLLRDKDGIERPFVSEKKLGSDYKLSTVTREIAGRQSVLEDRQAAAKAPPKALNQRQTIEITRIFDQAKNDLVSSEEAFTTEKWSKVLQKYGLRVVKERKDGSLTYESIDPQKLDLPRFRDVKIGSDYERKSLQEFVNTALSQLEKQSQDRAEPSRIERQLKEVNSKARSKENIDKFYGLLILTTVEGNSITKQHDEINDETQTRSDDREALRGSPKQSGIFQRVFGVAKRIIRTRQRRTDRADRKFVDRVRPDLERFKDSLHHATRRIDEQIRQRIAGFGTKVRQGVERFRERNAPVIEKISDGIKNLGKRWQHEIARLRAVFQIKSRQVEREMSRSRSKDRGRGFGD
ncbi:MAG: relaxase/mobilization nuclease domain-containing protein [Oligoflexus sp.]